MKKRAITSFLTVCAGCTLVFAQSKFVVEDDIYYQPNQTNKVVETRKAATRTQTESTPSQPTSTARTTASVYQGRDVDEYNRRYSSDNEQPYEADYTDTVNVANPETVVIYENPDKGYYLNGFNGNNSDYEYAERIRKFHNPKFAIHFSDPSYNDIYFLNSSDWNVYIDDSYAWVTPTWTNPWYWNYMWTPFSYSSISWRWGWGFSSWNWGWGSSWGCGGGWYDPFWGPSWGPSWGWGNHHHHHHYPSWGHGGYPNWNNRPNYRPGNVNGTSPRNPYYGRGDSYSGNRRPGTNVTTRPSTNGNQNNGNVNVGGSNTNIRPGNIRPGNTRPTTRPNTNVNTGESSRPSTGTNIRPSNNGNSTSRPSGNYARPSRNNGNSNSSGNSYGRPATESQSGSSSRPSYNNSNRGSDYRQSSGSNSYGGGRSSGGGSSSGGGGGRGGRR